MASDMARQIATAAGREPRRREPTAANIPGRALQTRLATITTGHGRTTLPSTKIKTSSRNTPRSTSAKRHAPFRSPARSGFASIPAAVIHAALQNEETNERCPRTCA